MNLAPLTLFGRNASPYTRRVAIVLRLLDLQFEQVPLSPFTDLDEIRAINTLGRVPALRIGTGEVLVESAAIIDALCDTYDPDGRVLPRTGPRRRAELHLAALCQTACDKGVLAGHEMLLRPEERRHIPYLDARIEQAHAALGAVERLLPHQYDGMIGSITAAVTYDFVQGFFPEVTTAGPLPRLAALGEACEVTEPFRLHPPEARMKLSRSPAPSADRSGS